MFKTVITSASVLCLLLSCAKPATPAYATVPSSAVDSNNNPIVFPDTTRPKTYLALGDSYTIGSSVIVSERFPVQTVTLLDSLGIRFSAPEIIAQIGWTTGNLLYSLDNMAPSASTYDIVTLLIGVNNQFQHRTQEEYSREFTTLLEKAILYAGNNKKHVVVLSIPDYSVTPYASGSNMAQIATEIDAFNAINKQIALQYDVNYLDITGFTRMGATDRSLIAGDGLHPSGIEYQVWAEHLVPIIRAALQ